MKLKLRTIAAALSLLAPAAAFAQATDCTEITAVPYIVGTPGVYCLKSSVSGIGGIGVNADNVTIDLNGYRMELRPGNGQGVSAYGTSKHTAVRNGTIRGGTLAVNFQVGSGHLVERIRAEGGGMWVSGDGSVVRSNVIVGTPSASIGPNFGIKVFSGVGMRVSDNA